MGTNVPSSLFSAYDPTSPTLTIVYGPSQFRWNLPIVGSAVFSKTLLKTRSPAWNVGYLTRLLYKFVVICWYDAIRIVVSSMSSSVISKSLARASVIYVRSVGIPSSVGIMASIP